MKRAGVIEDGAAGGFLPRRLSDDDQAFLDEVRTFLATHITDEVRRCDRETGDNFDEAVVLAAGAAGYLAGELKSESDGGFSPVRQGASGSWRDAGRACRGFTRVRRS